MGNVPAMPVYPGSQADIFYGYQIPFILQVIKIQHRKNIIFPFIFQSYQVHNMSREQSKSFSNTKNLKMNWRKTIMAQKNNRIVVPEAKAAMEQFKMQAANEVGVQLNQGYNGQLTSREAGSFGGQMVKKMIESYENNLSAK